MFKYLFFTLIIFSFASIAQDNVDLESLGLDNVDKTNSQLPDALPIVKLPTKQDTTDNEAAIKLPKIPINNEVSNQNKEEEKITNKILSVKQEDPPQNTEIKKVEEEPKQKLIIKSKTGQVIKISRKVEEKKEEKVDIAAKDIEEEETSILFNEEDRIRDLNELRQKYLIKINEEQKYKNDLSIKPIRKIVSPFISEDLPAPPILNSYRTRDNNHIPVFLNINQRIKNIFDAITSGNVAYFNSAYDVIKKPNIMNPLGDTLLTYAILMQKHEIVASLIAKGADLNQVNKLGYTPLDIAIEMKDLKSFNILVDNKADIFYVDNFGRTYLFHAARLGFLQAVDVLVRKGIDINAIDKDAMSALNIAYLKKQELVVKYLLANGAKSWIESPFDDKQKSLIEELETRWN